ncbi:MAG TPA: helix-turn-helix transcriptional regulator [Longimicrobiales bacterium]|nr:helix-turn-helix transcriptional regulator [Longimicrobiales bacterium]
MSTADLDRYLPLRTAWFHILLALGDGARHGYGIRADVEERTSGRVKLWPATLYGSIRELSEEGLIAEVEGEPAPGDDDPRRRYYGLTELGKGVLAAEVGRLHALVEAARATRALAG